MGRRRENASRGLWRLTACWSSAAAKEQVGELARQGKPADRDALRRVQETGPSSLRRARPPHPCLTLEERAKEITRREIEDKKEE